MKKRLLFSLLIAFVLHPFCYGENGIDLLLEVYKKYEIEKPAKDKVYYMQYYTKTISKQNGKPLDSEGTFDVWVSSSQMRVKGLDMETYRSDEELISVDIKTKEIMIADSKTTLFDKDRRLKLSEMTSSFFKGCTVGSFYRLESDAYPASEGDYLLLLNLSESLQSYTMVSSMLYIIRAKDSTICSVSVNYTEANPDYIRTDIWYKWLVLTDGKYAVKEDVVSNGAGIGEYSGYAITDVRKKKGNNSIWK